jgi:hypothetical protein
VQQVHKGGLLTTAQMTLTLTVDVVLILGEDLTLQIRVEALRHYPLPQTLKQIKTSERENE